MPDGQIELRLSRVQQMFNSLDPTPFPGRDLDDEAVRFIVGWAEEHPADAALRLVIHLPESERQHAVDIGIPAAITEYFSYERQNEAHRLRQLLRLGRRSALIGLFFLGLCNLASEGLAALSDDPLSQLAQQGLIIFGWVANWRPAEIFLYDWWPIRQRARLYDRLSRMPVELRFSGAPPP
jgi:hypothetical protein